MKISRIIYLSFLMTVILAFASVLNSQNIEEKGTIIVNVDGIKNNRGGLGVLIFNQSSGFPSDKREAYRVYHSTLSALSYNVEFKDIEFGTYAVTVFHDENLNRQLDTNWLGMPREGVGVSGEVKGFFGPRFKHSLFSVDKSSVVIGIDMKYLGD